MKFRKFAWCLAFVFGASMIAIACYAQSILDQSFTGPAQTIWQSVGSIQPQAQVYTAGITGNLTSVSIAVAMQNGGSSVVEILDPNSDTNGTWSLLGYTMISPPEQLNCSPTTCSLISASFSPPIPQVAGKQYAIAVYPAYVVQTWIGSADPNRYAGGGTYVRGPSWVDITLLYSSLPPFEQVASFYFQTYVKPIHKK